MFNSSQMIKNEEHNVTMEQVLTFSRESFGRLLAVLEPQVTLKTKRGIKNLQTKHVMGWGLACLELLLVQFLLPFYYMPPIEYNHPCIKSKPTQYFSPPVPIFFNVFFFD